MNEEQSNFNQNNSNLQNNNGIPSNQPLNNQEFNQNINQIQQTINTQPQQNINIQTEPTTSFQQAPSQMNMEQPIQQPINTIENGNSNNQNFAKPQKKINIGLIIGIVVAVAVIGIGIVFGSKLFTNENNKNNVNNNNNINNEENTNNTSNENNTSNNSSNEKYDAVLEWATPLLKVNGITTIPGNYDYQEIEDNINNYDIYVAIVKSSKDIDNLDFYLDRLNIITNSTTVKVFRDTEHLETITYDKKGYAFQPVYIVTEKGNDINNTDLKLTQMNSESGFSSSTLYVKDNNITPITSGKAKLGDCLTFTAENSKYYMVLVDVYSQNPSRSGGTPDYHIASDGLKTIMIRENAINNVLNHNLFIAFSNDTNIPAVLDENGVNGSASVYSSPLYERQSLGMVSFNGEVELYNYFNPDNYDFLQIKYPTQNDKLGIKFNDSVEINFAELYQQKNNY